MLMDLEHVSIYKNLYLHGHQIPFYTLIGEQGVVKKSLQTIYIFGIFLL